MLGPCEEQYTAVARNPRGATSIRIVGRLCLEVDGDIVEVPDGCQSLLAYLGVHDALRGDADDRGSARVPRSDVARDLWPRVDRERAAGNLRSALWRLKCAGFGAIVDNDECVSLGPDVRLDLRGVVRTARRIVDRGGSGSEAIALPGRSNEPDGLFLQQAVASLDLLPGWYDEWVIDGRERIRALVLDALDVLSRRRCAAARFAGAIELALVAIEADPFRESSRAALIAAHLGEHNVVEARRAFESYRRTIGTELGTEFGLDLDLLAEHRTHR